MRYYKAVEVKKSLNGDKEHCTLTFNQSTSAYLMH